MWSAQPINGKSLSNKTLCLTFDDGPGETFGDVPGPKTINLAEYLNDQGISATFFVVGKYVERYPCILPKLIQLGHLVGNHTYSHPDLVQKFNSGEDIVEEVTKTDILIRKYVPSDKVYFRAPYGSWMETISATLNQKLNNELQYLGPYAWDINGEDWAHWRDKLSEEKCAHRYMSEIVKKNHGIVLMHDSIADNDDMKANNLTFETIRIIVPQLKSLGYKFIRLDEI